MLLFVAPLFVAPLFVAPLFAAPRSRAEPIPLARGLPRPEGLGKLVIVSNYAKRDGRFKAVQKLAEYRSAGIVRFKGSKIGTVRKALASEGPEFVALAVKPETVDTNFHLT